MAQVYPAAEEKLSLGNRDGVGASFTAINNADYWITGLSVVEGVIITPSVSGITHGATYAASGRVDFLCSAQLANVRCLAIGYK